MAPSSTINHKINKKTNAMVRLD